MLKGARGIAACPGILWSVTARHRPQQLSAELSRRWSVALRLEEYWNCSPHNFVYRWKDISEELIWEESLYTLDANLIFWSSNQTTSLRNWFSSLTSHLKIDLPKVTPIPIVPLNSLNLACLFDSQSSMANLLGLGYPSTFSFRFSPSILKLISLYFSVFKLIKH